MQRESKGNEKEMFKHEQSERKSSYMHQRNEKDIKSSKKGKKAFTCG